MTEAPDLFRRLRETLVGWRPHREVGSGSTEQEGCL